MTVFVEREGGMKRVYIDAELNEGRCIVSIDINRGKSKRKIKPLEEYLEEPLKQRDSRSIKRSNNNYENYNNKFWISLIKLEIT